MKQFMSKKKRTYRCHAPTEARSDQKKRRRHHLHALRDETQCCHRHLHALQHETVDVVEIPR